MYDETSPFGRRDHSPDGNLRSTKRGAAATKGITKPHEVTRIIATEFEIRGAIAQLTAALRDGSPVHPNTWAFYSNKNHELLTIIGDVAFIECVLLEGDTSVKSYRVENKAHYNGYLGTRILAKQAQYSEVFFCRREAIQTDSAFPQLDSNSLSPQDDGDKRVTLITEEDVRPRLIEFNNWLYLSGVITRSRNFSTASELQTLFKLLEECGSVTIRKALGLTDIDPALMLAAIAKSLTGGLLSCNLRSEQITIDTEIYPAKSSLNSPIKRQPTVTPFSSASSIPHNRRTNRHPELFIAPWRWFPPPEAIPSIHPAFVRRIKAVQDYIHNRPLDEIASDTNYSPSDIRKKFYKTLKRDKAGIPYGVLALIPYRPIAGYKRKRDLPSSNMVRGEKGGYAGAFTALLRKFPDKLLAPIETEVLKQRSRLNGIPEARVSWVDLHSTFKATLRTLGVTTDEYPFNVRNCAIRSLSAFCNALLFSDPQRWIAARGGENPLLRSRLGYGYSPLITANAINQIKQLDFQKEDSAATVKIKRPKGTPLYVPVPRWWCGLVVDEYAQSIDATSDAFEAQETEESLMELVDNAISPPLAIEGLRDLTGSADDNWQPNQLIDGYSWQGWDILRIDRAWAHKAKTAVAAIISTIGCAVCYGPAGGWYARYLIEATNKKLTQSGPQKLPSTYGTGPADGRKKDPVEHAIASRITQDDVCSLIKAGARWINDTSDGGVFFSKPIDILRSAIKNDEGLFLPRPIPLPFRCDRPLMWVNIDRAINGNPKNGTTPYVLYKGCRFNGNKLGADWRHIRHPVLLQLYWRDFRRGRVVLKRTYDIIDNVAPVEKWKKMPLSVRDFEIIQNFGRIERLHDRSRPPAKQFLAVKQAEIEMKFSSKKRGAVKCNKDANIINRIKRNAKNNSSPLPKDSDSFPGKRVDVEYDICGALGPPPLIGGITKR